MMLQMKHLLKQIGTYNKKVSFFFGEFAFGTMIPRPFMIIINDGNRINNNETGKSRTLPCTGSIRPLKPQKWPPLSHWILLCNRNNYCGKPMAL